MPRKPVFFGIGAGLSLLTVYFIVLSIANSFGHAFELFKEMWYWITLLVVGFGIQVGLYVHIKALARIRSSAGAPTSSVAATGGISTGSMVACCAHHLTDVLPILGLSAAAVFLTKYQTLFIVVGVVSNLIGINIMLKIIQEHRLYSLNGLLTHLMKWNMTRSMYVTAGLSAVIFVFTLFQSL